MDAVRRIAGLYGIADASFRPELAIEAKVQAFLDGGACAVQLRMKGASARDLLAATRRALELAAGRALIIVNDRPDVALAAGADGVHVGAEDLPVAEVRRLVGPTMLVGATARTLAEARAALERGADHVGFGPVFATSTKALAVPPRGRQALAEVASTLAAPVVAIGGITLENALQVAHAGAAAAAVVSDVLGAADPSDQARQLTACLKRRAP